MNRSNSFVGSFKNSQSSFDNAKNKSPLFWNPHCVNWFSPVPSLCVLHAKLNSAVTEFHSYPHMLCYHFKRNVILFSLLNSVILQEPSERLPRGITRLFSTPVTEQTPNTHQSEQTAHPITCCSSTTHLKTLARISGVKTGALAWLGMCNRTDPRGSWVRSPHCNLMKSQGWPSQRISTASSQWTRGPSVSAPKLKYELHFCTSDGGNRAAWMKGAVGCDPWRACCASELVADQNEKKGNIYYIIILYTQPQNDIVSLFPLDKTSSEAVCGCQREILAGDSTWVRAVPQHSLCHLSNVGAAWSLWEQAHLGC